MAAYEPGHPLHHAANIIDGEHSLEGWHDPKAGAQPHAQSLSMRARMLGADVDDCTCDELLLVGESGPALVHEARRAINHGYPVCVVEEASSARESEALAIAYRQDGHFLVVDHNGGKRWEPGAFLMRDGVQLSVLAVKARPKAAGDSGAGNKAAG